jgi:hypothetical protein
MPRFAILAAVGLGAIAAHAQYGTRLDGVPLTQLAPPHTKAVVLFFVATECPVSNRTFPEMERLRETFSPQGIQFLYVYPNADETRESIHTHQISFDAEGTAILDPDGTLTRLSHAFVTPEAAILVSTPRHEWKPVYIGRIDDRYVNIGLQRPSPTILLADRALTALLAHQPIPPDPGQPVGCTILPRKNPSRP